MDLNPKVDRDIILRSIGVSSQSVPPSSMQTLDEIMTVCNGNLKKLTVVSQVLKILPSQNWNTILPLLQLSEEDLVNYLNGVSKQSTEVVRKKILFVGDARIGKTSLMKCFINQSRPTTVEPGIHSKGATDL